MHYITARRASGAMRGKVPAIAIPCGNQRRVQFEITCTTALLSRMQVSGTYRQAFWRASRRAPGRGC